MDLNLGPLGYEPTFFLIVLDWYCLVYIETTAIFAACCLFLLGAAWFVIVQNLSSYFRPDLSRFCYNDLNTLEVSND